MNKTSIIEKKKVGIVGGTGYTGVELIRLLSRHPQIELSCGGTGYTGVELIRLLSRHPQIELSWITSRSEAGNKVADIFPSLRGITDLIYQDFSEDSATKMAGVDIVFFATLLPHHMA